MGFALRLLEVDASVLGRLGEEERERDTDRNLIARSSSAKQGRVKCAAPLRESAVEVGRSTGAARAGTVRLSASLKSVLGVGGRRG